MKKVLLNLINIDTNISKLNYFQFRKYLISILLIIFSSCESPYWRTEINLPLLDKSYFFSEMLESEGIYEGSDELITLEFENTILDNLGIPPEYFLTSEFSLDPINFSVGDLIGEEMDIDPINVDASIPIDFKKLIQGADNNCIPREAIDIINIKGEEIISFPKTNLSAIDILFESYEYLTINDATIFPNSSSLFIDNIFFPIDIAYDIIGYQSDTLFTDGETQLNSDKNVKDEITVSYTITAASDSDPTGYVTCDECEFSGKTFPCEGWEYQPNTDYSIDVSGQIAINNIYSITGQTREYTIDKEPSFPLVANTFDILEGEISSRTINDENQLINKLEFNVQNQSEIPLLLSIDLLNFKDEAGNNLDIVEFVVKEGTDIYQEKYFNNSSIEYYPEPEDEVFHAIDEIYMRLSMVYPAQLGTFEVSKLLSFNVYNVSIKPIEFDKITTVVHDFIVDAPSLSLSSVPSGIEGVEFVNPILTINLDNMIEIDNTLFFDLESLLDNEVVSTINIVADLNIPEYDTNDIAATKIIIEGNTCNVFWEDILHTSYTLETTLVEFLQNESNELRVSGKASLNGQGNLYPGEGTYARTISGEFKLDVPFHIILGDIIDGEYTNINLFPSQTTYLSPVDTGTKESIDNSLYQASISSSIENNSVFVGSVSLIVSTDETFFPLNLDDSVADVTDFSDCNPCTYNNSDLNPDIFNSILASFNDDELGTPVTNIGSLDADNIESIEYTPISNTDSKVKLLKFISSTDFLLVGRLASLDLPYPTLDENGYVETPGSLEYDQPIIIDEDQISLINYIAGEKNRYINTLLELVNSHYPDDNNNPQNEGGEVLILSSHYINIQSYVSFIIEPEDY